MKLLCRFLLVALTLTRAIPLAVSAASVAQADQDSSRFQTSFWGPSQHGLQCRVIVPVAVEQGEQVQAVVELRCDPVALEPNVRRLNVFLPAAYLSMSLTSLETGDQFALRTYDPTGGMLAFDEGKATALLDGTPMAAIPVNFPLVKLYETLKAGMYDCVVRFSFPTNRARWWRGDDATWEKAGFWSGTVSSGKFSLNLRRETPKTTTFLLPKRLRLVKELRTVRAEDDAPIVPVPTIRFKSGDAEKVTVSLRNGHFIGSKCTDSRGMSQWGGPPKASDLDSIGAWYDYRGGDKTVEYTMEVFETADPPEHLWHPGPGSGGYRVLWSKTFSIALSEKAFRKQPAVALDLSRSRMTDAGLSILQENLFLEFLTLGNTAITDAGLKRLSILQRLETLHLYNTQITDAGLKHLKKFSSLKSLNLVETKVTDAGVAHLRDLVRLESLDLARTLITDSALENLKAMTNLKFLNLYKTQIGDAGLSHLRGLTKLELLFLSGSQVTDAGMEHLKFLSNLQTLRLDDTRVSKVGVNHLQRSLPECSIER